MIYHNGFFQFVIRGDGVYVKVFPPRNGGMELDFEEMTTYLNGKGVAYDLKKLYDQVKAATEPVLVKLSDGTAYTEDERLSLYVSGDSMTVTGRFIPPSTGGKPITEDEVLGRLAEKKICFGIDLEAIGRYLANREYCTDLVMARGKEPRHGTDAEIHYLFRTNRSAKPRQNEDGTVDFHDLDVIARVGAGDVLATLKPEDPGEPGTDVYGNPVNPRNVKRLSLKYGRNIKLSEDGLSITSEVSGHVSLEGGRVFVSNSYEIPANVDNSTGDIHYDGNVEVKGNVLTGFSIEASGDVMVNGVVEGARIKAGGKIILQRGIQGMNKGYLEAGSDVIAKFIENSEVKAGGSVTTDAIMHSTVTAAGDITVESRKGFATGGALRSGSQIRVKTAGSTMGTTTLIEVGVNPGLLDEYHQLEKDLEEGARNMQQNLQTLAMFRKKLEKGEKIPADKLPLLKAATAAYQKQEAEQAEKNARYEELRQEIEEYQSGSVKVTGIAYPGVKIVISNAVYFVRTATHHSQFVKDGADVKVSGL